MLGSQPQRIKLDKIIKVRKAEAAVINVITLGTSTNATDNSMILITTRNNLLI